MTRIFGAPPSPHSLISSNAVLPKTIFFLEPTSHLVGKHLVEGLPLADEPDVVVPILADHDLGGLGEGVVVLRVHAAAVAPGPTDDGKVADLDFGEGASADGPRVAVHGAHEVTRLAAVTNDDDLFGLGGAGSGVEEDGVAGAVEGGSQDFSHSRIELDKGVSVEGEERS